MAKIDLKTLKSLKRKGVRIVNKIRSKRLRLLEDDSVGAEMPQRVVPQTVAEAAIAENDDVPAVVMATVETGRSKPVNHDGKHYEEKLEHVSNPVYFEALKQAEKALHRRELLRIYQDHDEVPYIVFETPNKIVWAEPAYCWAASLTFKSWVAFKRKIVCGWLKVQAGEDVGIHKHRRINGTWDIALKLREELKSQRG